MNSELFLKYFHRISEAPDAIPRLRSFVIDLAVRGKLIAQDSNDEPASELLKRVYEEKLRLVKDGKINEGRPVARLEIEELPFSAPSGWKWTRLAAISIRIHYGYTASANQSLRDVRLLRITDIQNNLVDWASVPGCEISPREVEQYKLRQGDILIARTGGTIGKTFLVNQIPVTAVFASYLIRVQPSSELPDRYLKLFLESPVYWKQLQKGARGGGQPNVNGQTLGRMTIAVPPVAEQHRIVAKVDELMALCDQLEAKRQEREVRRDRLEASCLYHLNRATDKNAFRDQAAFYLQQLQRLTISSQQLEQLRQTILNLGVRGQLVPQSQSDEPAVELLKRIQAKKDRLVVDGKLKKEKLLPALTNEEEPFAAPVGWSWVRLDTLTQLITKGSSPKWQGIEYVPQGDGVLFVTSENVGNYRLRKMDQPKYVEKRFNEIEPRSILKHGDILLNLVGASIGRTALYDLDDGANINQAVALIRLVLTDSAISISYLLHYLNSPLAVNLMLASRVTTAQPNMSLTDAREFPVPIPPLSEQHRIVSKVNELMTVCDRLERQLADADSQSRRLLEAVLHNALSDSYLSTPAVWEYETKHDKDFGKRAPAVLGEYG